jgi:Rhodopirellula transposase DDE domain
VKVHDFEDKELGKVVPYGVYDVGANAGWVASIAFCASSS